jgi:L-asparaginase/Glu-tRNA(Gln) amidotransferase subunit D
VICLCPESPWVELTHAQAIGLDLTVNCSKPVIFAAAMRPDTYISPDGRSNFYQAVAAAVSPLSRDRGHDSYE